MRVVLDTNVLVSAVLVRGGNEDRTLRAWQRRAFELVLSPHILQEIGRVLAYEKIQKARWMSLEEIAALLQSLAEESFLVPGEITVKVCRDPEDNTFLAAAVEAGARYLVTGDNDLLDLKKYRGVRIVKPAAFLGVLRRAKKT